MLNWIWLLLMVCASVVAGWSMRLPAALDGALAGARQSVDLALGLVGIMCLWLGLMRLAERSGLVVVLARLLRPVLQRLFPDVPPDHPAMGSMVLNIGANMLGVSNAATPLGLRAMRDLETLNRRPGTATDAMCTFLAINTGSVQLIPVTAIALLAANGARNPASLVGTTLLATACSSVAGLTVLKLLGRLPVFRLEPPVPGGDPAQPSQPTPTAPGEPPWDAHNVQPLRGWAVLALLALVASFAWFTWQQAAATDPGGGLSHASAWVRALQSASMASIPFLLAALPLYAAGRGLRVHEEFVIGAREGFDTAIRIIPYLAAMLVAIGFFRGSGAIDHVSRALATPLGWIGFPPELLPMALLRPLTSSGTLALYGDLVKAHGADSYLAMAAGTLFGSTETTFYVLAVYFGSVGIRRTRHALWAGLAADAAGALAAAWICRAFMGGGAP